MLRNTFTGTVTGFRPSAPARPGRFAAVPAGLLVVVALEVPVELLDGVLVELPLDGADDPVLEDAVPDDAVADDAAVLKDAVLDGAAMDDAELDGAALDGAALDDAGLDEIVDGAATEEPVVPEVATAVPPLPEQPVTASPSTTPMHQRWTDLDREPMTQPPGWRPAARTR